MKRDMELVRKILFYIEDNYQPGEEYLEQIAIQGYDYATINEHCLLMYDNNLLQKIDVLDFIGGFSTLRVGNLSSAGYDFLEKIRNNGTWEKVLATIRDNCLDYSISTLKKIATTIISAAIEGVVNALKNGGV